MNHCKWIIRAVNFRSNDFLRINLDQLEGPFEGTGPARRFFIKDTNNNLCTCFLFLIIL